MMNNKTQWQWPRLTDTDILDKLEIMGKLLYVWSLPDGTRRWHVGSCMPINTDDDGFETVRAAIRDAIKKS